MTSLLASDWLHRLHVIVPLAGVPELEGQPVPLHSLVRLTHAQAGDSPLKVSQLLQIQRRYIVTSCIDQSEAIIVVT